LRTTVASADIGLICLSFLNSAVAFSRASLVKLGLLDFLFEFGHLVAAVAVAEFLLDRLHLLVEIVLALGLLHLPLHAAADALFHLEDGDLAFHQAKHMLQPIRSRNGHLEDFLLVLQLDRQMRSDRVGKLGRSPRSGTRHPSTSGETFLLSFT
jgi:hypothetical protein